MEKRRIRIIPYPLVELAFLLTGVSMITAPSMRFSSTSHFLRQLACRFAPEECVVHQQRLALASLSIG
jgi:hypothetical protein